MSSINYFKVNEKILKCFNASRVQYYQLFLDIDIIIDKNINIHVKNVNINKYFCKLNV